MNDIIIPESFPNLPSSIQKIQSMFASDDINSVLLVALLEEEPLISANILKLVNSVHYGLKKKVTSIKHAFILLGTTVIRGIAMATALKKSFPLDLSPYDISVEEFDKICVLRTRLIGLWLKDEDIDIETLSSVSFLIESGKIVTANEINKNKLSSSFTELQKEHSILEAENLLFHINSYQVAAMLFKQWQFDENFTNLISSVLEPRTREQKFLSVVVSVISTEGILSDENLEKAIHLLSIYDLHETKFMNAINLLKKEL